jgi:amino-acid N-acetyltransferase
MLTTQQYTLQPAAPGHRAALFSLLGPVHLPVEDLPPTLNTLLVAEKGGEVVGSVGLQLYGDCAPRRALAVHPQQQGTGPGKALYAAAADLAQRHGIRELYLNTTTAAPFFEKRGFQTVDRADVPAPIRGTTQFSRTCPASATVMRRLIARPFFNPIYRIITINRSIL